RHRSEPKSVCNTSDAGRLRIHSAGVAGSSDRANIDARRLVAHLRARTKASRNGFEHGATSLAYSDVWNMVDRCTDILADNGVRPQDIVGTLAPNSANLALLSLAAWQVGATLWPLSPQNIVQAEYLCSAPESRVWFLIDHSVIQDSVHGFAKSKSLRSWIPG